MKERFKEKYFVRLYQTKEVPYPVPTLNTYVFPGMRVETKPISTQQWRQEGTDSGLFSSQKNAYHSIAAQIRHFAMHKQLLTDLFDWFHCPRKRDSNFALFRRFEQTMQHVLSAINLELFKYRFIDVHCIENGGRFSVFSYPVSYEDADRAKAFANKMYPKWFELNKKGVLAA